MEQTNPGTDFSTYPDLKPKDDIQVTGAMINKQGRHFWYSAYGSENCYTLYEGQLSNQT